MKRDTISKLSNADLKRLIAQLELEVDDSLLDSGNPEDRLEAEELIFEEMEEIRVEREEGSTFPVQFLERKYSTLEDLFGSESAIDFGSFEFPEQYNVTRLVLMLRDPEWAFAYWDISLHDRIYIHEREMGDALLLRFEEEMTGPENRTPERVDLRVPLTDNRWYINIPRRGTRYSAQLLIVGDSQSEVLAKSTSIEVPDGTLSPAFADLDSMETELTLALSSIQSLGVSEYERIPDRVLRHLDES